MEPAGPSGSATFARVEALVAQGGRLALMLQAELCVACLTIGAERLTGAGRTASDAMRALEVAATARQAEKLAG